MKHGRSLCFVSSFFLLATLQACSQPQQVINSPCATLNATIQVKPSVDLSLMFGNDAIQTALDTITRNVRQKNLTSTPELTSSGTEAAIRTAEANGKNLKPQDKALLETYLRDEAIPAIRQNPACIFNVTSSAKAYFGVEQVRSLDPNPIIVIKNSGQGEGEVQLLIRQVVNGTEFSRAGHKITLGPGQVISTSVAKPRLPVSDILVGKAELIVRIELSYRPEPGDEIENVHKTLRYDPSTKQYLLLLDK